MTLQIPKTFKPLKPMKTLFRLTAAWAVLTGLSLTQMPLALAQNNAATTAVTSTPTPVLAAMPYHLPKNLMARYETSIYGLSGESVLTLKQTASDAGLGYDAELNTSARVLFKRFEMLYGSKGVLNETGLHPRSVMEKRVRGNRMVTTITPSKRRAVSNESGELPYDANGVDILSMAIQLGINQQMDARWQKAGMYQDFKVYRPSGMTTWRLQSQGFQTIALGDDTVKALYIKRIPIANATDNQDAEDQQHLWLDPSRYGLPVKMRFVDKSGRSADINLIDWQES
jgi:Protein of unknown function (DUF3108)